MSGAIDNNWLANLFTPTPTKPPTDQPPGGNARMWGIIAAFVGAFCIVAAVAATAWGVLKSSDVTCPEYLPDGGLAIEPATVSLNGKICVHVNTTKYFAGEFAKRGEILAQKTKERDEANAILPTVGDRNTTIKNAQTAFEAAEKQFKAPIDPTDVTLFLDGKPVPPLLRPDGKPVPLTVSLSHPGGGPEKANWVDTIVAIKSPENAALADGMAWRQMLSGTPVSGKRKIALGIGNPQDKAPTLVAEASPKTVLQVYELQVYEPLLVAMGAIGFLLLSGGVVVASWYTGLLRDGPLAMRSGILILPTFSLGRIQLAWWFLLISAGFVYIWLTTGLYAGVMTSTAMTLMGISALSGLAARVIDAAEQAPPTSSRGMLPDVLFDGSTISMHRLQMIAWTLLLGSIFIWSVGRNFAFPEFDPNLLVLAGIVNSTYIGFKIPEGTKG